MGYSGYAASGGKPWRAPKRSLGAVKALPCLLAAATVKGTRPTGVAARPLTLVLAAGEGPVRPARAGLCRQRTSAWQALFSRSIAIRAWSTFREHRWVISGER